MTQINRPFRYFALVFCTTALFFAIGCNKSETPRPQASQPAETTATAVDPATAASVSGTIAFSGTPPKLPKIDMSNDPGCKGENQSEVVEAADGHLANVLVYVKDGLQSRSFAAPQQTVTVKQEGCRYQPHVAAVMVGQPVSFTDDDPTLHNIHPSPKNNPEWNQSQMPNGPPVTKTFQNPELMMPIKCNQHPWMRMYLSVLRNPYFAVTAGDGKFTLAGLPPGTYTIAAVQEKYGEQDQTITVGPKEAKSGVDFSYKE
jgi:plastocyanin